MSNRRNTAKNRHDGFRFRSLDNVGVAAAEDDIEFLHECFVDMGSLHVLANCQDPRSIIVGRTGSGKTALIERLIETQDRAIRIRPESLALSYISNSTILSYIERLGVKLDIFFRLLWRHVFTVELIRKHFEILDETAKTSFVARIKSLLANKKHERALSYIEKWGSQFWEETEYRIREVTTNLENNVKNSVGVKFPNINFSGTSSGNLSLEERSEIVQRAQQVVNSVQIRELSDIIDMTNEMLSDPQKRYYLVIDSLDEDWIEDRLRYRLIRALIETVKDFHRIENAKIVVALRVDLLERVFKLTRDTGFQEEKYQSLYLPVTWTSRTLTTMLDSRVGKLIRRRFTKTDVTHKDILPNKIDRKPPMEYILERSLMRPRDVIMFFNSCINEAVNRPTISPETVKRAELEYSVNRLKSLADEWISDYPNLLFFSKILRNRKKTFLVMEITQDQIDEICLDYCIHAEPLQREDVLSTSARNLINVTSDYIHFRAVLIMILYSTGLVGLKVESTETVQWAVIGSRSVSLSEILENSRISVHPMFWRAFGINIRQ